VDNLSRMSSLRAAACHALIPFLMSPLSTTISSNPGRPILKTLNLNRMNIGRYFPTPLALSSRTVTFTRKISWCRLKELSLALSPSLTGISRAGFQNIGNFVKRYKYSVYTDEWETHVRRALNEPEGYMGFASPHLICSPRIRDDDGNTVCNLCVLCFILLFCNLIICIIASCKVRYSARPTPILVICRGVGR
jgi:hypothetical protein